MSTIAIAKLRAMYSGRETDQIRPRLVWPQLCNRNWESEIQRNATVKIPTRDFTVTASDYTAGANWKTPENIDLTLQDLTINIRTETGNGVEKETFLAAPIDVVAALADQHGFEHAKKINEKVRDVFADGATSGNTETVGSATVHVHRQTGEPTGTGANALVFNGIDAMSVSLMNAHVLDTGDVERRVFAICSPAMLKSVRSYALSQGWNEQMSREIVTSGDLGNAPPGYRFTLFGIDFYVTSLYKTAQISGKWHSVIMVGTREAVTYAGLPSDPLFLTPANNQISGPNYRIGSVRRAACKVVDTNQLYRLNVRAEA